MRSAFNPMGATDMAKDYIIDYGNNEDKSQWYRLWKSGWIEQGGLNKSNTTITFIKSFSDNNYTILLTNITIDGQSATVWNKSNTSFNARSYFQATTYSNINQSWYACGY